MSGRRKGRVLVVDDDGKVGQRLAAALQQAGYVVVTGTTNGRVGLLSDLFDPNVIITRLTESPSEGLAELRNGREVPVIVVAGADSSVLDRAEALRTGIDSLMTDPPPVDEVLARLEFLMRRRGVMRVVRVGDLTIDRDGHCVRRLGVEVNLTPREYDLVLLLASNPGIVLSKRHLLERVWNFDQYDVNVVEVHVSSLRQKLEKLGPRLIHTVRGAGYVMRGLEPDIAGA